eukprot:217390-Alexandrium_andersonii.AAC.1
MSNLPPMLAGERPGGASGGLGVVVAGRAYVQGCRSNRINRRKRTRREPNRPHRVPPWMAKLPIK